MFSCSEIQRTQIYSLSIIQAY